MSETPVPSRSGLRVEVHELPFSRESNRRARALLLAFLERQGLGTRVRQDATIVLGELIANGLDHGRPDPHDGLEVSWRLGERGLSLSVLDGGGATAPQVLAPDPEAPRGRGLAMVQALSTSWSCDASRGTRVTAVVDLT